MTFFDKLKPYAPMLVRYGVAFVFIFIGIDQFVHMPLWETVFPHNLPFGLALDQAITYNAIFDITVGAFLALGLLTRIFALIATGHLLLVLKMLGYDDITIRDIGVMLSALAVFCLGPDAWCVDKKIFR